MNANRDPATDAVHGPTYSYVAYGVGIRSMLALPELVPGEAHAAAVVRFGSVGALPPDAREQDPFARVTADTAHLYWSEAGAFLVRNGREIVVDPADGATEQALRLLILGPALALLLQQRGRLVLHASAVAIGGGAIGFLGDSGWGKSTTAAAFYQHGCALVADDALAVETEHACPRVWPGFPRLKLWSDAAAYLGDDLATLAELHPRVPKRGREAGAGFPVLPLGLRALYVLADGQAVAVEPLRPQDALLELVRHSHGLRRLPPAAAGPHFLQCAGLVRQVPVRRLLRPQTLDALASTVRAVEDDLTRV